MLYAIKVVKSPDGGSINSWVVADDDMLTTEEHVQHATFFTSHKGATDYLSEFPFLNGFEFEIYAWRGPELITMFKRK